MRLTVDLIHQSLSYINPLKERELDLRGHKIPVIENLGVATDQDAIDFTDNDIATLSNFPLSPRLQTLLLARNRVSSIHPKLHESIPNLTTLVLTQNRFAELGDLDPLANFAKLTHLVLIDNPVASKENYRAYILHLVPHLRFLDFTHIKDVERDAAKELFGTVAEPTEAAQAISRRKSAARGFDTRAATNGEAERGLGGKALSIRGLRDEEKEKIREMVRNATSLSEIERLEKALREGRMPG